jgi:ABC-type branched-subunit amino acid transport system ATPase component
MAGLGEDDIAGTIELIRKINKIGVGFVLIEHVMSVIHSCASMSWC